MKKREILVIEDDSAIRQGIVDALVYEGYTAFEAGHGNLALEMALKFDYDLLLLDLVLPGKNGLDILREVRIQKPTQPVIILSAKGEESDRVEGLRRGSDDYLVKPFSVKELLARIESVLRRSPERPEHINGFRIPGGAVDLLRREVRFDDGAITALSEREEDLLKYLAGHARRAVAREEILWRVWRLDPATVETRTIDMHVSRLREKLRDSTSHPHILRTVRGKGYVLELRDD